MRLLGAGDNVTDRYITMGKVFPGGNALNVAVFASRLGADASYMGVFGSDQAGQLLQHSLRREGVATDLVTVADGSNAYAEVQHIDGDRVFIGSDRGVALFEPTHEQLEVMREFDIVHTAYSGPLVPFVPEMAERTRVSFDFGSRYTSESMAPLLPHLYLAVFSGSGLSAQEAIHLAEDARAGGAQMALVTRGASGAHFATSAGVVFQAADRVVVRDTLGAGDAFIASLLVGLLSRRGVAETLQSASSHAAQVCMNYGAFGHGVAAFPKEPKNDAAKQTVSSQDKAGTT